MKIYQLSLAASIALTTVGAAGQTTNTFPATGSVGIGTLAPTTQLSVSGNLTTILMQTQTAQMQSSSTYNVGGITYVDNYLRDNVPSNPAAYMLIRSVNTDSSWPVTIRGTQIEFGTANGLNGQGTQAATVMTISPWGLVGIGTTAPGATLEVNGNVKLTTGSGASITFPDTSVQSTAWTGTLSGGDYAETVDVAGDKKDYEPGDVLVISPDSASDVSKSSEPYSTLVAGIYSTKPGVIGRRQRTDPKNIKTEVPMAMVGIVPTKVTTENGPVRRGDLLVTSSKPGYAMKGTDPTRMLGAVMGKALGSLDSGTGLIEVVVSLQ